MAITPILTEAKDRRAAIRTQAMEGLKQAFPMKIRDHLIELQDVKVHERDFGPNEQKLALMKGESLLEPVRGTVILKSLEGKELERIKNFTLLHLPYFTERHTFVLDGNEYQVAHQIRMKPGVYTRQKANGELEATFNLAKGSNFRLSLDPKRGHPYMEYGTTMIPLYPVLRKLGMPHQDIAASWGSEVAQENASAFDKKSDQVLDKLYGKMVHPAKQTATTPETKLDAIRQAYDITIMDPEVNQSTLGHPYTKVTPHAIMDAAKKLLAVYKGNAQVDDKDSLAYKTFHSVDDFIKERITLDARGVAAKVKGRASSKTALRDLLPAAPFTAGIRSFITGSQLSAIPTQINPMEIIDQAMKVTSLGEGGISSERAIPMEARALHVTHLGILDPIRTPESFHAGVDVRVATYTLRDEKGNLYSLLRNKQGKLEDVSTKEMLTKVIAFPGQKATGLVAAMKNGQVQYVPASEVDYTIHHASQLYSPTTNLLPLMESMQGNRSTMGAKMQTQALPLVHREVPWVQAGTGEGGSYEDEMGKLICPTAPVSGKVVKIDNQYIYIDPHSKKHAADTLDAPRYSKFTQRKPKHQLDEETLDKLNRKPLGELGRYVVYLVNGQAVRENVDLDFTEGGNPSRYGYIPLNEIWIEGQASELGATALHEFIEAEAMLKSGLSYDKAHDEASAAERLFRITHPNATVEDARQWLGSMGMKTAAAKRQKTIDGITFKIELEPGDIRKGTNPETGVKWEKKMHVAYGYIPKTTGDDDENVDIYLKEDGTYDNVYVVHQKKKNGDYDEDKCMIGFASKDEAKAAYEKHGPEWGFGNMDEFSWEEFRDDYLEEHKKEAADKDLVRVAYDTNFPFASKTYLNHNVTVNVGDHVKEGQNLADSNFTRDGTLALGKNMKVAYMAYYGRNANDAVVISEGAANKLTSEHMYKEILDIEPDTTLGREIHRQNFGSKYTSGQYNKLDEHGVIKKGQKVVTHDPLIVGIVKGKLSATDALLGNLKKTLAHPYREQIRVWEHDFEGEVIDVYQGPKRVVVTIKTREPMRIGDKLCYDGETEVLTWKGWKLAADVTFEDKVCCRMPNGEITYTRPTELHRYPRGDRMYRIASQQVDFLVTEAHKQFVELRDESKFKLIPARDIFGKRVSYLKSGRWVGKSPDTVHIPALTVKAGQGGVVFRDIPGFDIPVRDYLMLLGAFLSDGNTFDQPGDYGIEFTDECGPSLEELKDALKVAGFHYNVMLAPNKRSAKIRIHSKQLMVYFKRFGHALDKFIPDEVFSFASEDLRVLFRWLMWGDGYTKKLPTVYTTVSKRLADDVQRLCLHIGISANIQLGDPEGWRDVCGKRCWCHQAYRVRIVNTKLSPTVNHGHVKSQKIQKEYWIKDYAKPVYGISVPSHVMYVRRNGKPAWSGNSNRYGGKGVVSHIVSDERMVKDESGSPIDILYTPAGIVSRINPAAVIENALGKVVAKTGKPIIAEAFSGKNNVKWARELLKEHGLKDKETVFDPVSGKHIPGIAVGHQYTLRLFKTTDVNFAARGTGGYDVNQQPTKGGSEGAKALGRMEFNALVAHNARNVLRESSTIKSQKSDEFWRAVQLGLPLPPMRASFVYDKYLAMLQASGINVEKKGQTLTLKPMTDRDVLKLSSGVIENEKLVRAKDLMPERGGFFDPAVTGGTTGVRWSHIELAEPVVNPVFVEPARRLLGLTNKAFEKLQYESGGAAVKRKLNAIDIADKLKQLHKELPALTGSKLDDAVKQVKYLEALKRADLKIGDAYVLTKLPVLPPIMRPVLPGKGGQELVVGDSNYLYQSAFLHNKTLQTQINSPILPPEEHALLRKNLFTAVGAVIGTHESDNPKLQKRNVKGFIEHLTGKTTPKSSLFQKKLVKRQQDLSGRGTIAPDGTLGIDEIGIPKEMLWGMFAKFVVARLVRRGFGAVQANEMVEKRHPAAEEALLSEVKERPIMVNRAPTLHRYNIVGAYAIPTAGKTILLNPFIEKGMNADYDGDTMQVHVPVLPGAVEDVKKMTLSNLVLGDKNRNELMAVPGHESLIGIYWATKKAVPGAKVHKFKTTAEAMAAYHAGKLSINDPVEIG